MRALTGRITNIDTVVEDAPRREAGRTGKGLHTLLVRFRAAAVLPERTAAPEWLEDQTLVVRRTVADPRELGDPGDSIVLTPAESARWLCPLVVTPAVVYGEIPAAIRLRLRWWKEGKPPDYTVRINGQRRSGGFTPRGDAWTASVDLSACLLGPQKLPVTVEVTCEGLRAGCTVLPEREPGVRRLLLPEGEVYRLESQWYTLDVNPGSQGGWIQALRERGRGVDHFHAPQDLIQADCEAGGHVDRFKNGEEWSPKMREAVMTCAGARHEGGAARLRLEGTVDDGPGLRTSVVYTLHDQLPLLLIQRDYQLHAAKKPDGEGKEKEARPREPVDEMLPMRLAFRAAAAAERSGCTGSRALCTDGTDLVTARPAEPGDHVASRGWLLTEGWAVLEHAGRRECLLYLFDGETPPYLMTRLALNAITLEPYWPTVPLRPTESIGYTLALSAGEQYGAAAGGAWVGPGQSRWRWSTLRPGWETRAAPATARFRVGGTTLEAPLHPMWLPGCGEIVCASAAFPGGRMEDPFEAVVEGIDSRRSGSVCFSRGASALIGRSWSFNRLERCVSEEKLAAFAGVSRSELQLPIQTDWNTLEFALGINTSLGQLWERIRRATDRATQLVREMDLDLFPAAAHPVEAMYKPPISTSAPYMTRAGRSSWRARSCRYVPVFGALAANSPVSRGRSGGFKSYRMRHFADECTVPIAPRDPLLAQATWGTDACAKLYGSPTLEVRITDCASSRRLLAELATFAAAWVHRLGERLEERRLTPGDTGRR